MSTVLPSSALALGDVWPAEVAPEDLSLVDEQPATARAAPRTVSFTRERAASVLDFMVCSSELMDWAEVKGAPDPKSPEKSDQPAPPVMGLEMSEQQLRPLRQVAEFPMIVVEASRFVVRDGVPCLDEVGPRAFQSRFDLRPVVPGLVFARVQRFEQFQAQPDQMM